MTETNFKEKQENIHLPFLLKMSGIDLSTKDKLREFSD